jgi:hypothetical protein
MESIRLGSNAANENEIYNDFHLQSNFRLNRRVTIFCKYDFYMVAAVLFSKKSFPEKRNLEIRY